MSALENALALLATLVIDDGRRWAEAASDVQRVDAQAVLDPDCPTPYHFETRARGYSKTDDAAGIDRLVESRGDASISSATRRRSVNSSRALW